MVFSRVRGGCGGGGLGSIKRSTWRIFTGLIARAWEPSGQFWKISWRSRTSERMRRTTSARARFNFADDLLDYITPYIPLVPLSLSWIRDFDNPTLTLFKTATANTFKN